MKVKALRMVALILLIVGGLNWGLVALADMNLVTTILGDGTMLANAVYVLVALSAVYVAADEFVMKKGE